MAFYEHLFPTCVARGMQGGPRFIALEANTIGGQRYTNVMDPYPLHEFVTALPVRSGSDFEEVRNFFWVVRGVDGFRFQDPSDYEATQANTSLTLISGTTWQMNRLYASPGRVAIRPIYKPSAPSIDPASPAIAIFRTRSGVTTDITGTSTITLTNGQVVIAGHVSGDTYTWSGEFHLPVAFSDPQALFTLFGGRNMLTEWADITLRETRDRS